MKWFVRFAKLILGAVVVDILVVAAVSLYIHTNSLAIIESRTVDLAQFVSDNNCLYRCTSCTGLQDPSVCPNNCDYSAFYKLLQESETPWLSFSRNSITTHFGTILTDNAPDKRKAAISVTHDGKNCYDYASVNTPQRGELLKCSVSATISIPLFIFGMPDQVIAVYTAESTMTTMGFKFYKSK